MFLSRVLGIFTLLSMLAGCAGMRVGVTPSGHVYGSVNPNPRGYPVFDQPRFCANYHSNSSGCYGGDRAMIGQCKTNRYTGERVCRIIPRSMVGRW